MTDPVKLLRRELVAAGAREVARRHAVPSRPWPAGRIARRGRPALALAAVIVLASATAVAASQLFGVPVRSGLILAVGPKPGQVWLAPLRVSDPAGGLPWGVRIYTPRQTAPGGGQLSCVQIGRVLGGALGVVGEDGAFANDGLFHVLPVEPLVGCARAGTRIVYPAYVPASAFTGAGPCAGAVAALAAVPAVHGRRAAAGSAACPLAELRLVVYGVINGPARTVRLASPFGVESERLVGADHGAFVFVLPAAASRSSSAELRVTFSTR